MLVLIKRLATLKVIMDLGLVSVIRVLAYRIGLASKCHPVQRLKATAPVGPFFTSRVGTSSLPPANLKWSGKLWWFDCFSADHPAGPPNWQNTPFGYGQANAEANWWEIPDFSGADIKGVWELSRFGWLAAFATQAAHGDDDALGTMNQWLSSWIEANPPYKGVNWKCGQEASFRTLHLLAAAMILGQGRAPQQGLIDLITLHLKRIAPTLSYAIGQDNNHGTSEAAALFCGGSFLASQGVLQGQKWADKGRYWLENRARQLISEDGSFSQYSTVYHRLMLDTYSFVEAWRRRSGLPAFSETLLGRMKAATAWMDGVVDRTSGDAPNFGANDGARIMPFTDSDYRDFRPSLQTASVLFCEKRAFAEAGQWDDPMRWYELPLADDVAQPPSSKSYDNGGLHSLRVGKAAAFLRYPRFRFRPSQSDLLHFDLWAGGRNLLRDAGSFSYNSTPEDSAYFPGTAAHNTVEFDGRDQMPRLSRFLYGEWAKAEDVSFETGADFARCAAAYTDSHGMRHHREIVLRANSFICRDTVSGTFRSAVLRWRLMPGNYSLHSNHLAAEHLQLRIECDDPNANLYLTSGEESLYYMHKSQIPVLELAVSRPCSIVTTGEF